MGIRYYKQYTSTSIHPLLSVIDCKLPNSCKNKLIDLFCNAGLIINDFIYNEDFYLSSNLNMVKYIIEKSNNYKYMYLHEICSSIKSIIRKTKNKKHFEEMINYIVTINHVDEKNAYNLTAFQIICGEYVKSLTQKSIEIEWYEYIISKLLVRSPNSGMSCIPLNYFDVNNYMGEEQIMHCKLNNYIDNIMVTRDDAIDFVKSVSEYLLPDIANVVFAHGYIFNYNIHYDLAHEVY
jgi:hypothetical protein